MRAIRVDDVRRGVEPFAGAVELLDRRINGFSLPALVLSLIVGVTEFDFFDAKHHDVWVAHDKNVAKFFALFAERVVVAPK